jgi:hypothetical protein
MPDPTLLRLAPASVFFDSVHLGYLSFRTAVEIEDDSRSVELMAGQPGDTPVDEVLTGHRCTVRCPVVEVTPDKLALAIPNSVIVGSTVTIKNKIGQRQRSVAKELRVVRLVDGEESILPADIFVFPLASPKPGTVTQTFGQEQQELLLTFQVWMDPTTKEFYHVG